MVRRFTQTRFAAFLMHLTGGVFTAPSRQSFLALALGWTFALGRHTVATYLWRSGATALKHFTRFYVFLGAPFRKHQDLLFERVIRVALQRLPESEPVRVYFDETTCKKSGRKIEGASSYRNGAGTARQEYRTLFGLNFVLGVLRLPLPRWSAQEKEAYLSVPVGLRLYLKKQDAEDLEVPYHSRSQLARQILDRICVVAARQDEHARRTVIATGDGNYSTKAFLQDLPENADVVGRFPIDSRLYEAPPTERPPGKPGPMPTKGPEIGSAQTLAEEGSGFAPHPAEENTEVRVACGIWHSVLPGVMLRVVVVRRPEVSKESKKKELEAFFTTLGPTENESEQARAGELSGEDILQEYGRRWSVEIMIREAKQFGGLGKDRCRKLRRIQGVNAFRLFMLAATRLCFAEQVQFGQGAVNLKSWRPWYKQKDVPSGRDVLWNCRAKLLAEGITPTVGFEQAMGESHRKHPATQSRATRIR